jgi:hypothetical protein
MTAGDAEHAGARRLEAQPERLPHASVVVDDQRGPRRLRANEGVDDHGSTRASHLRLSRTTLL